mmetsp:Transcript_25352/g.69720  ORF Transcript_25352/g.69720 Transcript_25352/m.69720 type:complete len:397 (-) Transcript_25352:511-1701(-)
MCNASPSGRWPPSARRSPQQTTCAATGCLGKDSAPALGNVESAQSGQQAGEGAWTDTAPLAGFAQGKLSASAVRRRRRQRAASLATKLAMERNGNRGTGQIKAAPRSAGNAGLGTGRGKATQCSELMESLEAGGKARASAVAALRSCIVPLAFDAAGCRAVQLALHVADRKVSAELADELRGHVCEAIRSPHANYVIQKVIEVLPMAQAAFVAEELSGMGVEVARHRYGCRILCRLLEHSANDVGPVKLIDEVLEGVGGLCRHSFGHYVIQSILEHGTPEQRHLIASALRAELARSVQNRNACYVIENALSYCSAEDRHALVEGLLSGGPGRLAALAQHQFGSHVVRALLRMPGEGSQLALGQLRAAASQLSATKYGRRLLEDFGLGHVEAGAERI